GGRRKFRRGKGRGAEASSWANCCFQHDVNILTELQSITERFLLTMCVGAPKMLKQSPSCRWRSHEHDCIGLLPVPPPRNGTADLSVQSRVGLLPKRRDCDDRGGGDPAVLHLNAAANPVSVRHAQSGYTLPFSTTTLSPTCTRG